jgi:NTE family protein
MEHLTAVWRGLRGEDVYPQRRVHGPWIFLQQRESVHPNTGLRKIIEQGISFERLEDAEIPFEVVATSLEDGREQWLTSGPAVEAILASAAIPAIFPPVEIDGRQLIDGGVVDNVPIGRAIEGGAARVLVLLCGPLIYTPPISRRPVEAMLNALFIAVHARFSQEMARLPPGVEVIVFSGGGESSRDYTDFSDTDALIAAGRAEALKVLRRHGLVSVGVPAVLNPPEGVALD